MNIFSNKHCLILLVFFFSATILSAQRAPLDIGLEHIKKHQKDWGLSDEDIQDLRISDLYQTKSNGVTHLYLNQRYRGIDVLRGLINISIDKNGKAFNIGHRFTANLQNKVNTTEPNITPSKALILAATHVGLKNFKIPRVKEEKGLNEVIFDKENLSEEDIKVQLCYHIMPDGQLRLSWNLAIRLLTSSDFPSLRVDALTGEILEVVNWTHACSFHESAYRRLDSHQSCKDYKEEIPAKLNNQNTSMAGQYNVFELPIESPAHGSRSIVSDPHYLAASPYGWHDTNGAPGAEYTITRGNNAHAYQDTNGNNLDSDDEPDGGASLTFDFPMSVNSTPEANQDAAVTNLFYVTNFMHDFAYAYGFDEPAGNFQQNNYGNGGFDNDYVRAEAQDGDNFNNAFFTAGPEGSKGRMEMFLWDRTPGGQQILKVNSPSLIAGGYIASLGDFGPPITSTPITGDVVIVDDGVSEALATDGCEVSFTNGSALNGKIALIDRGGCDFEQKTVNAEEHGAIAVIVCDFNPEPNFMNGIASIPDPGIPTIRIGSVDCQKIRVHAATGLNVSLSLPTPTGPEFLDGDFDNGIIAHEYTHGISERLTGGPNTTLCLNNDEQMGEGWSDFFALASTVREGDSGEIPRGLATFLYREDLDANGVRNYPYSTDMEINPLTYRDIGNERIPHGLGAVWCSMIWDLYWNMVEVHGWSPDLFNGNKGNNMAIQLVMDGMKLQPCKPGFVDARDAILLADEMRYDGANRCLISETFARRGLGAIADQGDNDGLDAIESFDLHPLCVEKLKIYKTSSKVVNAGANYNIFIEVYNHNPQTMTNVVVNDELPAGLTFTGNTTSPATVNGNFISFELGTMEYLDTVKFFYQVSTNPFNVSLTKHFFNAETEDNWEPRAITPTNNSALEWQLSTAQQYTGASSWRVTNTSAEVRQQLILKEPILITGINPTLRFFHRYKTQGGVDGGTVEISTDPDFDTAVFHPLTNEQAIRNGYPGFVQYTTFIIPNLQAFSGTSNNFIDTYFDLSDYRNKEVYLRFNFASSNGGAPPGGGFWFVDDIEILDLAAYNGEACVSSDQSESNCVFAIEGGTVVESQLSVNTNDLKEEDQLSVDVYPNPASGTLHVNINSKDVQDVLIELVSVEGKSVLQQNLLTTNLIQTLDLDITNIPVGLYFVKVYSEEKITVKKVIIK